MLLQICVQGLVRSGVYAMLTVGFTLVFGVARLLNLAHTAFYMAASYAIFYCVSQLQVAMPVAMLASTAGVVVVGLALLRLFVEPVRERPSTVLIATFTLGVLMQEVVIRVFGGSFRTVPALFPGYWRVAGLRIGHQEVASLALAVVCLLGVWALLWRTKLGLAVRAAALDREVASLMGVDVQRLSTGVLALGLALVALAGGAVAPLYALGPHEWPYPLVMVLAAVVLGGMGSLWGSLLGAVLLAFVEAAVVFLLPGRAYLATGAGLLLMLAVFMVRPQGLLGVGVGEER